MGHDPRGRRVSECICHEAPSTHPDCELHGAELAFIEVEGVEWCVTHSGIVDEIGTARYDDQGGRQCDNAASGEVCSIVTLYRKQTARPA